jgi:putative PIN family toxin of toxin-antitoxin system
VIDTNVFVSGLGWGGKPGDVVEAALGGRCEMVTSPALLAELQAVLAYPRLAVAIPEPDEVVRLVLESSAVVFPRRHIEELEDEADNRLLEAAEAGEVDYLVTGDRALLERREWGSVRIVSPSAFWEILSCEDRP